MKKQKPPTIHQDCIPVVMLVTKGGGISRAMHLKARMNLGREMIEEKFAMVVYTMAAAMKADGFSKPYNLAETRPFAKVKQGEEVEKLS
jgi:hypothetical protein